MSKVQCQMCQTEFFAFPSQERKYCSRICGVNARRKIPPVACVICGTQFIPKGQATRSHRQRYCSLPCRGEGRRTRTTQQCALCDKIFFVTPAILKNGEGKFCSQACAYKSRFREPLEERIARQIDFTSSPTGCHLWQGAVNNDGYPSIHSASMGKKHLRLNRWILEQTKGPPPQDKPNANHTCHTPLCLNGEHLYWGSQAENMKDMKEARHSTFGEKSTNAKLTEQQVIEIRTLYWQEHYQQQVLAARYGISRPNICVLLKRQTWNHIPLVPQEKS